MRVLVQELHIGMRGRAVEIEVILFYVLAMISFVAREAKEPLLQNRIALIPQRKAHSLPAIADAGETVLIPAIRSGTGVVVRQVFPGVSISAVVFAYRSPGTLAEIRPPALPMLFALC